MRKVLVIVLVLVAASVGGWKAYHIRGENAAAAQAYKTITIENGNINEQVTAQGKLEPKSYVDVGTQVSGQIKKIHVDIGDAVDAGQLLAEIDPRIYQSQVDSGEARIKTLSARLAQQDAQLLLARRQHARNAQLVKSDAVSRDAYEQSEAALRVAEASLKSLQAEISEAQSSLEGDKTNLAYTRIDAPMTGTVVDIPLREGQTVNASQSAPTILTIADLGVMTVRAQVAEADIMRISEGMPAYFTTMGQMDRRWEGRVRQVLPTPEVVSDVVLYHVLVDAENKDNALMSGMSTQVFFTAGAAGNVPLVPVEALVKRRADQDDDRGTAYAVTVMGQDGKTAERIIHTGLANRTQAEIRDGLTAGERIVLPGAAARKDDAPRFSRGPRL